MTLVPSSRAYFRVRVSALDACFALLSPLVALWVRDAPVLSEISYYSLYFCFYWACSTIFSLLAFSIFRLEHKGQRYFSVDDIFDIAKAVVVAELLIAAVMFSFTRLEGIPRSTLFVHALILATALVAARMTIAHFEHRQKGAHRQPSKTKYVVVIGSKYLSSAFIKWLETNEIEPKQVMAILDDREEVMGRKISGVQVLGSTFQLEQTVEEFSVHGVKVDEVIVSNGENQLAKPILAELQRICRQKEIELTFLPQLFHSTFRQVADSNNEPAGLQQAPTFPISSYFEVKRVLDFVFALLFTALLSPVFICVSVLVALDVGTPLVFWQRRLGQGGRGFQIYKFRTMQTPFDRLGESLPENRRLSLIGHLLRKTGLDELPQLLNVLVGDMSLVGPRPLLSHDQPADPTIRLMVRPGITGWAQVNGGKQITNEEKYQLDEWYIHNASPLLDLRILLLTCRYVFIGDRTIASPTTKAASRIEPGENTQNDNATPLTGDFDREVA
jgi:lipopolysaccharide/colanic/teichoic acid biosynthesis glycosyltransferase